LAGTIIVDRIESDASYASNINVGSQITFSNTVNLTVASTFPAGTVGAPSITTAGDTNTGLYFPAADTIGFVEGGAEVMRINSSGNVGIGTTSPSYRLEVKGPSATAGQLSIHDGTGDTVISGTNAASLLFQCRDSSIRTIAEIDGVHTTTNGTGGAMVFQTRNSDTLAECGRFANDGSFLVGSTANIGANAKIYAVGSGKGIAVGTGPGSNTFRHLYMNSADTSLYFFNDANYASLNGAGAWTNASDARLKKNIVDIKYGLADVLRMQPRSYQMNAVAGDFVGFVAQELQEVIPEVVSGDPEKQLGVDYGSLVAVAFKAIQELKALNDTQAATITALTARIVALES
jgi:hypothetical protein